MPTATPILDQIESERMMTASECARILKVSPSTVTRWALDGAGGAELEHTVIAGRVSISRTALERFLAERTENRKKNHRRRFSRAGDVARRAVEASEIERELDAAGI